MVPDSDRMAFRQEFEKLHSAVESIDQKMGFYACFLPEEGIAKILRIVRVYRISF